MTYRRDSDIYDARPYGAVRFRSELSHTLLTEMPNTLSPGLLPLNPLNLHQPSSTWINKLLLAKKTKPVVWFVSNCHSDSLREEYFSQVGNHIPVDVFGSCGKLKCTPMKSLECDQQLDSYKFYIAAENSICADYVTEKLYRALISNIVPIVYGGADYSAYAPRHSYIHVGDFKSPKALADYLWLLYENDELYLRYFEWKKFYEVLPRPTKGWCDLCEKLNDPNQQLKIYEDLKNWWFHREIPCVDGKYFLRHLERK